jgi:hypothetical protein
MQSKLRAWGATSEGGDDVANHAAVVARYGAFGALVITRG